MIFRKSMKSFIFSSSFFDFFQCQLLLQQLKTPSSLVTVWGFLSSQINSRRRGAEDLCGAGGEGGSWLSTGNRIARFLASFLSAAEPSQIANCIFKCGGFFQSAAVACTNTKDLLMQRKNNCLTMEYGI